MTRADHTSNIKLNCPDHFLIETYFLFDEEGKAQGIGCERCYQKTKVYDDKNNETRRAEVPRKIQQPSP